jgi:phage gp46-like protein
MKENEVKRLNELDRKVRARLVTGRRVEGDRLMLADAVLLAALDGTRPLTAGERAALEASPLTARRLRQLALDRRSGATRPANDGSWEGSGGMLRAADSGVLTRLVTDDGWWTLHFTGAGAGQRVILQLDARAPFAARLVQERVLLRVTDGAGSVVLHGQLDADGECEGAWPFPEAPARYFQHHGAAFAVSPAVSSRGHD